MSKEKIDNIKKEIADAEALAKKKKAELFCECNHKNKNGKLKLEPTSTKNVFVCKRCEKEMDLRKLEKKEAQAAIEGVDNMIQQIKCFSNPNSLEDEKLMKELGKLSASLPMVLELYNKVIKAVGKKSKKEKKGSQYGQYGFTGMKFK